jgi:hypothetical protein
MYWSTSAPSGARTCTVQFHLVDAYNSANERAYYCAHNMAPYDQIQYLAAHTSGGTITALGGSTSSRTISGSTPAYQGNYSTGPSGTSSVAFDAGLEQVASMSLRTQLDYRQSISRIVLHTAITQVGCGLRSMDLRLQCYRRVPQ